MPELQEEHPRRFQTFQILLFQLKIHRISHFGPWLGRQSIPPSNPIDYQPEDGATKLSNENSAI